MRFMLLLAVDARRSRTPVTTNNYKLSATTSRQVVLPQNLIQPEQLAISVGWA
jgi:hypothetical protein